jgi:cytochrome c biogenesis protein
MPAEKRDLFKDPWDFFCSLKLTVFTLLLLAATSVVGTLLPQNLSQDQYRQLFAEWVFKILHGLPFISMENSWWLSDFPQRCGEVAFSLVKALHLHDMYHSWWFLGLLGVFALNLTACSLRRLPGVWRTATRPVLFAEEPLLRSLQHRRTLQTTMPVEEVREKLEKVLRGGFARPRVSERDGAVALFAQRRPYARFSVYLTHLSILLILFGAVIGSLWGLESYVTIVEGQTVDKVPAAKGDGEIPLGFSLRCDDFSVSYYEGGGPREFRSVLTVLENGREIPGLIEVPVLVNHPLKHNGLWFYQTSYGLAEMPLFRFGVTLPPKGDEVELSGRPGRLLQMPNGGSFQIVDFSPSYRDWGAVAVLEVKTPEGNHLNAMAPTAGPLLALAADHGYKFRLLGMEERYYTGLKVARDPGVWVVWAGCLLLVLGSLSAFFLSHQRLWLVIRSTAMGSEVKMGASAHRNQPVMARLFDRLGSEIAAELGAGIETVSQEVKR